VRTRQYGRAISQRASEYFEMSGRAEFVAAAFLFALMLAFKIVNAATYVFDSDESQHLHVIWGWANGFVQYRDVCDNHMPLFQIIFTPIYKLIGERATILYWMRIILLPMYFVVMWCTYRIGALCFSRRAGVWAVIVAGFYPGYHFCSMEFRTDNLWAPLWLLTLVVLLSGAVTFRRSLLAGLLLGLCFGISMKSVLLLLSILTSGAFLLAFLGAEKSGLRPAHLARCVAVFLAGAAFVPGAIMLAFALGGVWGPFRYWVFQNNILPQFRNHPAWWIVLFPLLFPLVIYLGRALIQQTPDPVRAARRGFIFFIWGFYILALWSFWSLVSRQDYLPYHPLAFVLYSPVILVVSVHFLEPRRGLHAIFRRVPLPAFVAAVEFLTTLIAHPFWVDGAKNETDLLRATLKLTARGDFVLDEKGETVFRQRCFAPIWEPCVMERIRRGLMADNAAQRCFETRTCVAVTGKEMSLAANRFVLQHYLPVGNRLRVAGTLLRPAPDDEKRSDFEVVIPASYSIMTPNGNITGFLDGEPYRGGRFLAPGKHTFLRSSGTTELALLWTQAADRGFTPFHSLTPEPKN